MKGFFLATAGELQRVYYNSAMQASPSSSQITAWIKKKALALGFARVGIIPAAPFKDETGNHLQQWLAMGYHADMEWMVTHLQKRLDPASLMDGAKSIVCVAMNYYTPDTPSTGLKIARYARGTDYHDVLKRRLKTLLAELKALLPDIQGRALTDSAPIMEKPLAIQAGIGWMGKNGNVIVPGLGSWVFLGELLLDIELEYDVFTEPNHCGRCRRCIDACPTGAIVQDGVVDANRCISYWTIEAKQDAFPASITNNLNGWIFGCDICQEVCPWNSKFSQPTDEPEFQPRPLNREPDPQVLLNLTEEEFKEHYRKSPIKRAKHSGFLRNIRQALAASETELT
jgi:epoxyqueuosine reductase